MLGTGKASGRAIGGCARISLTCAAAPPSATCISWHASPKTERRLDFLTGALAQRGLVFAEAMPMSKMSDEPSRTARVSIQSSQELSALQQTLLESVKLFAGDVRRFSH